MSRKSIKCMYQDHAGFVWLGTEEGLFKYNGITFQSYFLADTSLSNHVTSIFQDKEQQIWAGYYDGTIASISKDILEPFIPDEGTPVVPITAITQDSLDVMWFGTYGEGIYYYKDQRLFNLDADDGLADNDIYDLAIDQQGRIWAGTDAGASICAQKDGGYQIQTLTVSDGLTDNIVRMTIPDAEGNIWIGTYDRGFCKYDCSQDRITFSSGDWEFGRLTSMQWTYGSLFIGTENKGIVKYNIDKHYYDNYHIGQGLGNTKIIDLIIDKQQNLWVANNNSQIHWTRPSLMFSQSMPDNNMKGITSIAHDISGAVWIGNDSGLFHYSKDTLIQHLPQLSNSLLPINCIYNDPTGTIWLGTWNGVLAYKPSNGTFKWYREKDGLVNNNVLSIVGMNESVWIATLGGVSKLTPTKSADAFENFHDEELLGAGYVYSAFVDNEHRVWFATDGRGLIRWEEGRLTSLIDQQPEASKVIYSITQDHDGSIWFSTPSDGVYCYNGIDFSHYGLDQGLRDLDITGLGVDRQGNLVIAHSLGLDLLNPLTGDILSVGDESGINGIEADINSITVDNDQAVWVRTKNGLIRYDAGPGPLQMSPKVIISKTSIFFEPFEIANKSLKYHQNHLSFEYIGLWYQNPQDVVYEHKLEGFDLDWNPGKSQITTYPKLPAGNYTFKVRASINGNFNRAEISSINFSVDAPFWMRSWFMISAIILGLLSFLAIVRFREKRLRSAERLKKELIQTQLDTLKSQVNPHFLFNSFNTLAGIIEDDTQIAVEYVENLSDFFRATLEYRDKQLVTVKEELSLIEKYYFLQQKRYGDKLTLQVTLDDESLKLFIPPLTLQVLIENTIKHNIISQDKPLTVKIYNELQYLYVVNNKQAKPFKEDSTGFGLVNIVNRYNLLTNDVIKINDQADHIYSVGVPLIKMTL